jgi:hypothetical protein
MSPTRLAVLVLSALTFAVCGCGGSTATTATTTTTSGNGSASVGNTTTTATNGATTTAASGTSTSASRTVLITNANAICKRLHAQLRAFSAQKQGVEQIYAHAATDEQAALVKLHKLNVPAELSTDWNQVLNAMGTLAADSAKYAEDAKTKHMGAASSLSTSYGPIKRPAVAVAVHDGLTECGLVL